MPFDPAFASKYGGNQQDTKRKYQADPLIEWADRAVPIVPLLNKLGLHVPDGANNWRTTCPFAYEHPNKDKGFRVHAGNNNCYCYGWHGFMTSSKLWAHAKGMTRLDAAKELLDSRGLRRYHSYQERWNDLKEKQDKLTALSNDQELLAKLQFDASHLPGYTDVEFEESVRNAWARIMPALNLLTEKSRTQLITVEHLDRWYTWSVELLAAAIEEERDGKVTESEATPGA